MKAVNLETIERDGYKYTVVALGDNSFLGMADGVAQDAYLELVQHSQRGGCFDVGDSLIMGKINVHREDGWNYLIGHPVGQIRLMTRGDIFISEES